jgi:uncharacterized membrane protein YfcA
MMEPWIITALTATAVLTGFIDAIAGGGGLIMMPALLFAGVPPIDALGTNKLQSMFGTATSFRNFAAKGMVDWRVHKGTIALVFVGAIGAYDGFFGPGTGSFFTASLVGFRGLGLTRATALTKLFNLTSNVASVIFFALGGKILWLLGLSMAAGAMLGGYIGSNTAMRFGAKVIRPLLVTLSLALTARLLWTYFAGQA